MSSESVLERDLARTTRERDEARRDLGEILAVIHRDGGHHTGEHGLSQSVRDAHAAWAAVVLERDESRAEVERLRAELSALRIQRATERARDGWAEVERLRAERDEARTQIAALRGVFGECLHPEPVMSGRGVHKRRVGSRACGECKACVSFGALEKGVK